MPTTIEITDHRVRLCRYSQGRIAQIESFAVERGGDPIVALAEAPLPKGLGKVRVMLHHPDLLIRTMVQPVCPQDRLQRIIEFELKSVFNDEFEFLCAWHMVPVAGTSDDMRVLVSVAKRSLVKQLNFALAKHGGTLGSLVHPGVGLLNCFQEQTGADERRNDVVLVDVGGEHLHTVMVHDGELVFIRTNTPGQNELIENVADLRGISLDDARDLVKKLTSNAPEDIRDLITRRASAISTIVNTNVRFAKAQFRLPKFDIEAVYLSGAGAQLPGLVGYLKDRIRAPVRILNPFASRTGALGEQLDSLAELPSPWCPVIGCSLSPKPALDVLEVIRERKRAYWMSSGSLRLAAAAIAALVILALAVQHFTGARLAGIKERLDQLNPDAEKKQAELDLLKDDKVRYQRQLEYLAGLRRPARVMYEMLGAVSASIHPTNQRVVQRQIVVNRVNQDTIEVHLVGYAEPGQHKNADAVLKQFEADLRENYPVIQSIQQDPVNYANNRMEYSWHLYINDSKTFGTVDVAAPDQNPPQ